MTAMPLNGHWHKVPLAAQINDARRELAMRERLYPQWVRDGRMKQHDATLRIAAMQAIIETLIMVQTAEAPRLL